MILKQMQGFWKVGLKLKMFLYRFSRKCKYNSPCLILEERTEQCPENFFACYFGGSLMSKYIGVAKYSVKIFCCCKLNCWNILAVIVLYMNRMRKVFLDYMSARSFILGIKDSEENVVLRNVPKENNCLGKVL